MKFLVKIVYIVIEKFVMKYVGSSEYGPFS